MRRFFSALIYVLTLCMCFESVLAADFETTAREVKEDLFQAKAEQRKTKEETALEAKTQQQVLAALERELEAEKALLDKGQKAIASLAKKKVALDSRLEDQQAEIKELSGLVRAGAKELLALAGDSPVTADRPERLKELRAYLDKSRFPGLEDIRALVDLYFEEIEAGGHIKVRKGLFVDRTGQETMGTLVRLGGFNTLYSQGGEVGYATIGKGTGNLLAIGGDLPRRVRASLREYINGRSPAVFMDISGGGALSQLSREPTLKEHILAGGFLVWPILCVGFLGLLLIIERLFFLQRVNTNTDGLMVRVNEQVAAGDFEGALVAADSQRGRPTSNVIKAGLALKGCSGEVIQSGLAEAMLREMPRLERFLTVLKVFAAIAPLLGLLGTVTGMINTFTVITTHGTGDPRLLAGGISEALITTQLGLAVAIPLLVMASLLTRRAQQIASDMEEKAVGLAAALVRTGG